ncbi:MAG TPA: WD40 repeat domain-containing protein, partial [Chloroflexota bacterium]|nr:WD40 repeat domain-containing protein [Chloroflexota bacterium]
GSAIRWLTEYELAAWVSDEILLTAEAQYNTRLTQWHVRTGEQTIGWANNAGGHAYAPNGLFFARQNDSGSIGREVDILYWRSGQLIERLPVGNDILQISWSPDGRYLAATLDNGRQIALFPGSLLTPTMVTAPEDLGLDSLAAVSDGWSTDGRYLAIIGQNETEQQLLVYDVQAGQFLPNPPPIDSRAGLDWSPREELLLFTGFEADSETPTLQIMDVGGNITPFQPADNHPVRAEGVWSPDGKQIAYIATNTYTHTQDALAGSLWIAAADGSNPQQRLAAEEAIAPFWDARGEYLYFTRFLKESGRFELQRLDARNTDTVIEIIGPGTENVILYPFDRNTLYQWSPDGRQLLFQGVGQLTPPAYLPLQLSADAKDQLQSVLPVKGIGLWSPDGRRFAGTYAQDGRVRVWAQKSDGDSSSTPDSTDLFAMPADGWSPDGNYAALLRFNGADAQLSVLDVDSLNIYNGGFTLDLNAGISWHPQNDQVMVTAVDKGITTSLQIFDVADNSRHHFAPQDNQLFHADGVWSPDGRQVAYIARDTLTETTGLTFHTGSLWIANTADQSARPLVTDGLNFAPLWDAAGNRLLFTRYLTETDTYDLYQVNLTSGIVERSGLSSPEFAQFPFDRQLLLRWSPDGRRWLLPGVDLAAPQLLYRADQNNVVTPFPSEPAAQCRSTAPYAVRWAPTNRAVLIACPPQPMSLHWLDSDTVTPYGRGEFPTWQP